MNNLEIIKTLYKRYTKQFLPKIFLSVIFSVIVAVSTSAIAWLLDPAIKKIFIEKDQSLIIIIPLAVLLAFASKGASLYYAKTSGTTSGVKYIPLSKASMPTHITAARDALLNYIHKTGNADFVEGKQIFLQGSPILEKTKGINYGRF